MNDQHDVLGRRTQMVANGQQPVTYGYDIASRLTQVAQGPLAVGLGYDNANRRTSLMYPNGTSTSYTYDVASRLTNINHIGPSGIIEALTYQYDPAGNRTGLTRSNGTASNLPAAVQAAYDAANEQVTFNSLPATFDAIGNLTTSTDASGTTTYTWDARNRMIAQAGPGVNATFQYDALGRRVSKTVNGVTTSYLYDGNDIVQEIGGSAVGTSYVRNLNIDDPFVRQTSTGNEFYHVDALGSTLDLTNQTGAVQASYQYEAFGKTTMTGSSSNPFQYTGREKDGTGLTYYRARYYSPSLQRFISEDPIGVTGGINFYVYVDNTPVNWIDPFGLIRYNNPAPKTVPVQGQTLQALQCLEQCLRNATGNCQLDLLITGGAEQSGHSRNSDHYKGEAVDIAGPPFNPVNDSDVMSCAAGCGFGAGQFELFPNNSNRNHWHLQLYPGNGVPPIPKQNRP